MQDEVSAMAREYLAAQFPTEHSQWGPFRKNILDGSCAIHSDSASAVASMGIRAIEAAIRAERERCAGVAATHAQKARERVAICQKWSPAQAEHSRARDMALDIEEAIRQGSAITERSVHHDPDAG
jgi:hypothetical protein